MSRNRHLALVPANDLVNPASVFNRDTLLGSVSTTEHERRAAAKYLRRTGNENLIPMILGGAA